jgi:Zn-finger nucleic acid-binding protein
MQEKEFDKLDELAEMVNDKIHELYKDGAFLEITNKIKKVSQSIANNYSVTVDFQVNVFESTKEKSLRALTIGISSSGENSPYLAYGDSSPCRYLVGGDIIKVPHDYCPSCWGAWDFKLQNHTCPECGIEMGKDVKLLLDTDTCPNCEDGSVSLYKTKCDKCGFEVDKNMVNKFIFIYFQFYRSQYAVKVTVNNSK